MLGAWLTLGACSDQGVGQEEKPGNPESATQQEAVSAEGSGATEPPTQEEPQTPTEPKPANEPSAGKEPSGPEAGPESGPEPGPEPNPEPGPEYGPEPTQCPSPQGDALGGVKSWKNLKPGQAAQTETMPACGVQGFRIVGAKNTEFEVHIKDFATSHTMSFSVLNARAANKVAQDAPLAKGSSGSQGWMVAKFKMAQSGETSLVIDSRTYPRTATYSIQVFCTLNCQLETTRFPIVLMHGFAGTDKYFGILDYFYQVKPHLEKAGYSAFTPSVQPIASSTQRVLTLKKKLDDIFKQTGARKLNLIAHSQGGVDGRLLISLHNYGDVVASLTTISTPHRGIPVPNLLVPPSQELGESNMKKYNQLYPNDKRVKYFSWAGASCGILDRSCRKKRNDETIDPLLVATFNTLKALRGDNDGVVPVSSAKWGTYLGEITADHWDEVGQVADRNNKSFNHKDFYLNEAKRLRKLDF